MQRIDITDSSSKSKLKLEYTEEEVLAILESIEEIQKILRKYSKDYPAVCTSKILK